jgi:hypothetical protein
MEKMPHDSTVYRLPPCKDYPKGMRVYKSTAKSLLCPIMGQLVCSVKDGKMFYTKQPLTESK